MRKLRRFQSGGDIPAITPGPNAQIYQPKTQSEGSQIMSGIKAGLDIGSAVNKMGSGSSDTGKGGGQPDYSSGSTDPNTMRRGGPIRKTYGPKIGKEDGIIAAQKGEYVVKKSAVNKLGKKTLDTINRGKIPDKGARRGR